MAEKFRKNPVEIDAMPWDGTAEGATPIIDWVLSHGGSASYLDPQPEVRYDSGAILEAEDEATISVKTLEGWIKYPPNYTFIRGVQGEFYACESGIFAQTYTAVDNLDDNRRLIAKCITVDYDSAVVTIDGEVFPWAIEADPVVTANTAEGQMAAASIRLLADEVTVRGVPQAQPDSDIYSNVTVDGTRLTWKELADHVGEQYTKADAFARIIHDLSRNEHGRHEGDVDGNSPSLGNPHLPVGTVFGYSIGGSYEYVVPPHEDAHKPEAWRRRKVQ